LKQEGWGYQMAKKVLARFRYLDTIPACDGRTDASG